MSAPPFSMEPPGLGCCFAGNDSPNLLCGIGGRFVVLANVVFLVGDVPLPHLWLADVLLSRRLALPLHQCLVALL